MSTHENSTIPTKIPVGSQLLTIPQAFQVAIQLHQGGDLTEAETIYRQILDNDPNHADSYHRLGMMANQIGMNEVAVQLSERALQLDPELVEAHNNLGNALQEQGQLEAAVACYRRALALQPDFAKAHCNLGNAWQRLGRAEEAIGSYRQALSLQPNYAEAHNNLGFLFMGLERMAEALAEFRQAVACKPELAAAAHMIAVLTGETTAGAPAEYVRGLFDQYSLNFERHLVENLQYDIPRLVFAKFEEMGLLDGRRFRHTLDLGCGTGLSGELFRGVSEKMSGMDLSEKMLAIARGKKIYDRLLAADMRDFFKADRERYDLFLAFDSLIYLGELAPLLQELTDHSLPGAYVAFTTESIAGASFALQPSTRYAHSPEYIVGLGEQCGWRLVLCEAVHLRKDKWGWIAGNLFIWQVGE